MKTKKAGRNKKAKIVPVHSMPGVGAKTTNNASKKTLKAVSTATPKPQITYDMIAERAWSIWMAKGCESGQDEMNWNQAELELRSSQKEKGDLCDTDKE